MDDKQQANAPATQNAPITQSGGGEQPAAQSGKTFTQEQLEAIITERLARERSKYADYDALKNKAQEIEDAKKSEIERAQERALKAEQKAKELEAATLARLTTAEARAIAAELGFAKPDKAIKLADLTNAVENGEVNADKIKTALESLAKEMPELLTRKNAPAVGATNPTKSEQPAESREARMARLRGGGQMNTWLTGGGVSMWGKQPTDSK